MRPQSVSLHQLIRDLPVELRRGDSALSIATVVEDSRQATPGALFVARPGESHDGRAFIADAIRRGAVAVLSDGSIAIPEVVADLQASDVPRASALIAERFFGDPGCQLRLVGVTGTNGKTTIAHLIHQLLNGASVRCGMVGTVEVDDGASRRPASFTTPPALELSRLLRTMVDHHCEACVMEASSHALQQRRTAGLAFEVAIFTNLSGDHMDYHGTPAAYLDAKAMLFESLKPDGVAIVNHDDPAAEAMLERVNGQALRCSLRDTRAECYAELGATTIGGGTVVLFGPWGQWPVELPLAGRHNVMNALQAAAACHCLGADVKVLQQLLSRVAAPPGRLEPVPAGETGLTVLVDYAHTDDALENVLTALRPLIPTGNSLIVVFGCGGDRDRSKRRRMAGVACRYANKVVVTSDNPRTEDPRRIVDEIYTGVPSDRRGSTTCVVDRSEAIGFAIDAASPGDVVLIAGKGHEDYQIVGTTKRPFDDRLVATDALRRRAGQVALS